MTTIVITGGIACGKSTLAGLLVDGTPGSRFFDADREAHQWLTSGDVVRRITEAFGSQVLDAGGGLSRNVLRELVLFDRARRLRLEAILHPLVRSRCLEARERALRDGVAAFIADIPLYFEAVNFDLGGDPVVVVAACRRATQLERLIGGRGLGPAEAAAFIDAQIPVEVKMARADHVVWNDGAPEVLLDQGRLLQSILNS